MKSSYISLILPLLLSFSLSGQYYSFNQHVQYADECYNNHYYLLALQHYTEASKLKGKLQKTSLYNYADAAYNVNYLSLAEQLFMNYQDQGKIDNDHEVLYKLIDIRQKQERYDEAILDCNIYISEYEDLDSLKSDRIKQIKESCQWALSYNGSSMVDSMENMKEINSAFSEHAPYLFDDSLYYSAVMKQISVDKQKTFISRIFKEDKSELEIDGIEQNQFISHPAFTVDGTYMLYTVCDYNASLDIECEIYFNVLGPEKSLGVTRKMTSPVNMTGYSNTHPFMVPVDTMFHLYFSSNRPGGKGGFDIYRAELSSDMMVQKISNLDEINTAADEYSPYLNYQTNDVYFSSTGHPGFGGFDIFKVNLEDENPVVKNVGNKINSSYNDVFFSMNENGSVVYLSSNRPGSNYLDSSFETCCYDIYKGDVTECSINLLALIYSSANNEMIEGAHLKVIDPETDEVIYSDTSEENIFEVELECDKEYVIETSKEGFDLDQISFKPSNFSYGQENEIIRKIYLDPSIYDLDISVLSKDTNLPLDSVDFVLKNLATGEEVIVKKHPSNNIHLEILPGTDYKLDVSRNGYLDTTEIFNSGNTVSVIKKIIYLEEEEIIKQAKVSLAEAIPVELYFDHDNPKPGATDFNSATNYTDSYQAYYEKRGRYIFKYVERFSGSRQDNARREASQFFDNEVKAGFEKYDFFKDQLLLVLQSGQSINVYLRGYASPIALDEYNKALGRRRVDSVRQEFDDWNNGALLPYIESGQLIVTERSFGEETSPSEVSDDPRQPYQSIYSPAASRERRVEIDEINFNEEN